MTTSKITQNLLWPIVVLVIAFGAFYLKPWQASKQQTISVSAEGKTETVPNIAKITATVETKNQNLDLARSQNQEKVTALITKLKDLGIAEKDIKTQNISAYPGYGEAQSMIYPAPPRPNTNQVSTTLEITIRDFTKADSILAALTQNGASNLYGPNLTISDDKLDEAKSQARQKAVEAAKKKAQELASASGRKIGKVTSIKEQGDFQLPQPIFAQGAAELQQKATQIMPGQNEVSINLEVDFALK